MIRQRTGKLKINRTFKKTENGKNYNSIANFADILKIYAFTHPHMDCDRQEFRIHWKKITKVDKKLKNCTIFGSMFSKKLIYQKIRTSQPCFVTMNF